MKKIIILFIVSTLLIAQNPKVYSVLGNVIYDNANNIEKLKFIEKFSSFEDKIDKYVIDVNKTKNDGFLIETGTDNIDKAAYLDKLRELAKINDFFVRSANSSFEYSINNEDSKLFSEMINSGLIDMRKNKSEIINYYLEHSNDINATGVLQEFLDEDQALRKEREDSLKLRLTTKEQEEAKIKRIRKNDQEKQEAIQKSLEEEVVRKKIEIRKNQIKELRD